MMAESGSEGVSHVVHIRTGIDSHCELCDFFPHDFAPAVNHFMDKHGYRLLHVGTETTRDDEGKPWHTTVAVLGG